MGEIKEVTKRCKNCDKEVSVKAKKCPFCQSDLRSFIRRHLMSTFLITLFLLTMVPSGIGMLFTNKKIQKSSTTKPTVTSTVKPIGKPTPNPVIGYSLLGESTRQSDVKNIFIKERYILLEKKAPTIEELTKLATVLGKNNENIEFIIFDDAKAYQLYKKYIIPHKEEEASDADWEFLYDHFLAWYLKANTYSRSNYLQPVGNIYHTEGQAIKPNVQIVN